MNGNKSTSEAIIEIKQLLAELKTRYEIINAAIPHHI
jgi:hypothetical protein